MPDETTTQETETTTDAPTATVDTPEAEKVEETVSMSRAEADALRRKLAEAERDRRKLADERKKDEEARQVEQGQFKELAEKREQELAAERAERARAEREQRITRLATQAKFIDPSDVIGRITADEGADDASVGAALERIAQQSPHLIAKEAPVVPQIGQVLEPTATATAAGKPAPPPGKSPLQSLDEANSLPVAEVVARMDEVEWLERHEQGRK